MVKATIIIPTFNHGPTLRYSVVSALAQTIQDVEVLIIGDGMPASAVSIAEELVQNDARVRLYLHPKGPRTGEAYRHPILMHEAQGEIVCYLCDDDLYLPHHVETLYALLGPEGSADFAHTLPVLCDADGALLTLPVDLSHPHFKARYLAGHNSTPLSAVAHRLDSYKALPFGWQTTPEGTPTDLYMFQQFLQQAALRFKSYHRPTTVHFPSPMRTTWTLDERVAELADWSARLAAPRGESEYLNHMVQAVMQFAVHRDMQLAEIEHFFATHQTIEAMKAQQANELAAVCSENAELKRGINHLRSTLCLRVRSQLGRLRAQWRQLQAR